MKSIFLAILRRQTVILGLAILLYAVVFTAACWWKYDLFLYNNLDLAIFNNVFWQTAHGNLFGMTIHPHSYLGDHAAFGLLALVPLYKLWPGPEILLLLQTLALAFTAWPIFLLARHHFAKSTGYWQLAPLVLSLAWLLNPLVHSINLFEFHLLPFALPFLFLMLLSYERERKTSFIIYAVLAMLFREDVSLVVAAVGLLAALEKKSWWWRLVPIALGAVWFVATMRIIGHFAPAGDYKFGVYYSWLLNSPEKIFGHLLSAANLEMLIGFLLPLAFLPLATPKKLLLAAGPALQILLSSPGGSSLVLHTHYAVLFLPAIFIALVGALTLARDDRLTRRKSLLGGPVLLGILLFTSLYGLLTLGPLPHLRANDQQYLAAQDAQKIMEGVGDEQAVVASYALLPQLSSRENIYAAHYAFIGRQQFGTDTYAVPSDQPLFVAFDQDDLLTYRASFTITSWAQPFYSDGRERLALLAGPVRTRAGRFVLHGPPTSSFAAPPLFDQPPTELSYPQELFEGTNLLAKHWAVNDNRLQLALRFKLGSEPNLAKLLRFSLEDHTGSVFETTMPLINDFQQSAEAGNVYEFTADIPLPTLQPNEYRLTMTILERESAALLDAIGKTFLSTIKENKNGYLEIGSVVIK